MMDISNNADVPRSAQESNGKDENQTVEGPGPTHTGEFNERINISNGSSPFHFEGDRVDERSLYR